MAGLREATPEEIAQVEAARNVEQDVAVRQALEAGPTEEAPETGLAEGEVKSVVSDKASRIILELIGMIAAPELAAAKFGAKGMGFLKNVALRGPAAAAGGAAGSLAAEFVDPSEDPLRKAAETAVIGGLGEAGGMALVGGIGKALAPFKNALTPGAGQAMKIVNEGGGTTPADRLVDSNLSSLITNIADAALLGGKDITRVGRKAVDIVQTRIEGFAKGLSGGASREEVGVIIQNAIADGTSAFRSQGAANYRRVDELSVGVAVDITALRKLAQDIRAKIHVGIPSEGTVKVLDDLIKRNDNVMSFEDASVLRSDLLAIGRSSSDLIPGQAQGVAKRLSGFIDDAMKDGAKKFGDVPGSQGQLLQAEWRAANAFWKQGKEVYNNKLIVAMARNDPDAVFEAAIRGQRPVTIRRIRNIITKESPEAWRTIQGRFIDDLILKATGGSDQVVSGTGLLNQLRSFGDEALAEVFTDPGQVTDLKRLFTAMASVQSKEPGLGLAVQLTQAGLLAGIVFPGGPGLETAVPVLLGPALLGKIIASKLGARWLTTGFKAPPGSEAYINAIRRLGVMIAEFGFLSKEEFGTEEE